MNIVSRSSPFCYRKTLKLVRFLSQAKTLGSLDKLQGLSG